MMALLRMCIFSATKLSSNWYLFCPVMMMTIKMMKKMKIKSRQSIWRWDSGGMFTTTSAYVFFDAEKRRKKNQSFQNTVTVLKRGEKIKIPTMRRLSLVHSILWLHLVQLIWDVTACGGESYILSFGLILAEFHS